MADADRLAVQLYTLRNAGRSFEDRLDIVADAGYGAVETVGTHGLEAEHMREALSARGLRAVSSHVSLGVLRADLAAAVRFARTVGHDTLVMPWLAEDERPESAERWKELGRELDALGERCRDLGARLLYHNHDFELEEVSGAPGLVWLADAAAPDHLGFEPDPAWIVRAGVDPVTIFTRLGGRCPRVHLKDVAPGDGPDAEEGWRAVGAGVLDWDRLLPAAKAAGAQWYVVEHDRPKDPAEAIRASRDFLRTHRAFSAR